MKTILTLLFSAFLFNAYAGKPRLPYIIHKDTLDASVPKGMTKIIGTVYEYGSLSNGALISNCTSQAQTNSNIKGEYSFLVPSTDSCVYAYKQYYGEIIINPRDFKDRHTMVIDFYLVEDYNTIEVDKPVIYVYAEEETPVSIEINPKATLTFTYPKYNAKWDLTTSNNGGININNKNYPYLFWEGEQENLNFIFSDEKLPNSYQIKTDSVIPFLETELSKMGLNPRETTDFITFWGPRMMGSKYALVQFLEDDLYESEIGSMEITPTPASIKRVYLLFAPLNEFDWSIPTQSSKASTFQRNGLTIVEWGGSELELKREQF